MTKQENEAWVEPEEQQPEEASPTDEPHGTSARVVGKWMMVMGSSTVFHVLLFILLGLVLLKKQPQPQQQMTIELPSQSKDRPPEEIDVTETDPTVSPGTSSDGPTGVKGSTSMNPGNASQPEPSDISAPTFSEPTPSGNESGNVTVKNPGKRDGSYGRGKIRGTDSPRSNETSNSKNDAITAALTWLARHQNKKGYWDADRYDQQCPEGNRCERRLEQNGKNDVGITGLAILAYLGAGYDHREKERLNGVHVGSVINDGLRWLKRRQKSNGAFDWGNRQMYNHAIATMAYAEAYGMTGAPRLKGPAQKGIDFLENAQNESGGDLMAWRYRANDGENDTSVTGWCAMALKSARLAGLETSKESLTGALRWVEQNTNQKGLTGYTRTITSRNEARKRRSMTAVGMMVRMFADKKLTHKDLERLKKGADFVVNHTPEWQERAKFENNHDAQRMDFYHWYYGSLALFMFAGPGTKYERLGHWKRWRNLMQKALLSGQQKPVEGHEMGSWDPLSRWANRGGRIYVTALNALTLEVNNRYDHALFSE